MKKFDQRVCRFLSFLNFYHFVGAYFIVPNEYHYYTNKNKKLKKEKRKKAKIK